MQRSPDKTTQARRLGEHLGIPVLVKDDLKEILAFAGGSGAGATA
ncbi:MAG: hypothetical protein ACRDHD_07840 [Candidatus Limnocylindria bacterium]